VLASNKILPSICKLTRIEVLTIHLTQSLIFQKKENLANIANVVVGTSICCYTTSSRKGSG
jgi:hypothetical protein